MAGPTAPRSRLNLPAVAGAGACVFWAALCVRWFDAAAPLRPAWLAAMPPAGLALPALALAVIWARARWSVLWGTLPEGAPAGLLLVVALAILFRLPLAWWGAAGYLSADESLTGILTVHVREGIDHQVFLPQLQYNGTLRAHLAAPLSWIVDTPRAFVLLSVVVYALFVAAVYRLGLLVASRGPAEDAGGAARVAIGAGLYAAFAPTFVTQYCLMTDVYVEVLAFGTWALLLAIRWVDEREHRALLALAIGLMLGLGFWCHILAIIHVGAVGLVLLVADAAGSVRALPRILLGFGLGYLPGLLWNATHDWESFRYLIPGVAQQMQTSAPEPAAPGLIGRAFGMIFEQAPILLGYDPGYPGGVDVALHVLGALAAVLAAVALVAAARSTRWRAPDARWALLALVAVNVGVALVAVRYIPGDPRYILFLMAAVPVLLADTLRTGWRRWILAGLVGLGALGTLAQSVSKIDADARWRRFVADLEREGVRFCSTDFFLASKINFLSEERIVCSSKLGPNRTEYFFDYRRRVEAAPAVAFVAVNTTNAEKLERRLDRLGVTYQRRDLMKPVLLRLSRKVDPEELFPGQEFGLR